MPGLRRHRRICHCELHTGRRPTLPGLSSRGAKRHGDLVVFSCWQRWGRGNLVQFGSRLPRRNDSGGWHPLPGHTGPCSRRAVEAGRALRRAIGAIPMPRSIAPINRPDQSRGSEQSENAPKDQARRHQMVDSAFTGTRDTPRSPSRSPPLPSPPARPDPARRSRAPSIPASSR
jgi:hypothetical protein